MLGRGRRSGGTKAASLGKKAAARSPAVAEETLTRRQLNRATLARQMLLARETVPVAEAVARLGGLQAQEPRPPFAGLWSRVEGFQRGDLVAALQSGDVVRGLLLRAT